jgi:hypothetical protein
MDLSDHDALHESLMSDVSSQKNDGPSLALSSMRWRHVGLYVLAGVANALILLTWAPISDLAGEYWDVSTTLVNLLSITCAAMYIPGTMVMVRASTTWGMDFRGTMLTASLLNATGVLIRFLGGLLHGSSQTGSFVVVFLGTAVAALSQPFYLNLPAALASRWFDLNERDIAMTLCSLASPLGSAIGSVIPPMIVTRSGDNDDGTVVGVTVLLGVQLVVAVMAVLAIYVAFHAYPDSPPTMSAHKERLAFYEKQNKGVSAGGATKSEASTTITDTPSEFWALLQNRNFCLLFMGFTVTLAHLNSLAVLLNQLPGDYSNGTAGLLGASLILCGFLGAFLTGFVLEWTKAYQTVLKVAYSLSMVGVVTFLSNCHSNNQAGLIISAGFLGLVLLPIVPSAIVNTVEVVYPLSGDMAVGMLYSAANVMAVPCTFIGQVLLAADDNIGAPLFPYGIWMILTMCMGWIPVLMFQGNYTRLREDKAAQHTDETLNVLTKDTMETQI